MVICVRTILYAIAMVDYDQDNMEVCKDFLKTKAGINRLAPYHSSVGRLSSQNATTYFSIHAFKVLPPIFQSIASAQFVLQVSVQMMSNLFTD
ncbi:Rab escort protein 1 [Camellia lanceoleosa]|uniref:Rab escort protein 1 n=1 Tax=Camellia lanceoleosa TaxID=1840588 RepID=A0ACC0H7X3_9ERIC|nr:Rab escort protein 1 [Camellia lanceoleosa]